MENKKSGKVDMRGVVTWKNKHGEWRFRIFKQHCWKPSFSTEEEANHYALLVKTGKAKINEKNELEVQEIGLIDQSELTPEDIAREGQLIDPASVPGDKLKDDARITEFRRQEQKRLNKKANRLANNRQMFESDEDLPP